MNETRRKLLAFATYFSLACLLIVFILMVIMTAIDPTGRAYTVVSDLIVPFWIVCMIAHTLLGVIYAQLIQNSKMTRKTRLKWIILVLTIPVLVSPILYAKHRGELGIS